VTPPIIEGGAPDAQAGRSRDGVAMIASTRRQFLSGAAALALTATWCPRRALAQGSGTPTRLILLGTGGGDAYGPPPLKAMTDAYWQLNRFDIETRIADEGRPDLRALVVAHEFDQGGPVMQNDDVKVTAARVFHPPVTQSYAYRFDAKDRSIVLSGDTGYSQELIALTRGADGLVHEVMHLGGVEHLLKRVPNAATLRVNLVRHHTSTEDVGRVAAAAGVNTVVLTHFVPPDDPTLTDAMWLEGVRKHFSGRVVMGQDLLEL